MVVRLDIKEKVKLSGDLFEEVASPRKITWSEIVNWNYRWKRSFKLPNCAASKWPICLMLLETFNSPNELKLSSKWLLFMDSLKIKKLGLFNSE